MPNPPLDPMLAIQAVNAVAQHGSQDRAARALGMSRATLQNRIRRAETLLGSDNLLSLRQHERNFIELAVEDGTVLVCSDVHAWPGEMTTAQRGFLALAKKLRPAHVVINGDLFDGAHVSRFTPKNHNQLPTVRQEIEACQAFVEAIKKASPGSPLTIVVGNHDERYTARLVERVPEYAGVQHFDIRHLFPEATWCYRLTINPGGEGMTDIVHCWAAGIHGAYNNVLRGGVNYVTGHTHRGLTRPWNDRAGRRYGVETGTLIDIDGPQAYYVAGRPVDWHPSFVVLTYRAGRLLRPEHVDVHDDGVVSWRGELLKV